MKAYLWSTNSGNVSGIVNGGKRHRQGTKPASAKIANCSYSYFFILILIIIINVNKTLILGLPRKQNGRPVGYITLLPIVSPLERGVRSSRRLVHGLLKMTMPVGPLMDVKDPSKVRNRRVAKSIIVLIPLLILILIDRLQ